ncbi:MAG: 50S ribosomal protein L1, partial [Candidatus Aenigmatarchaeota archaeon]
MNEFLERVREAREKAKPRRFKQSWDFSVNLKGLDLKKPENRINAEIILPEGLGRELKVAVIADSLVNEAKKSADLVITKEEIEEIAKNRKRLKKIAREYDRFLGEASLMPTIGKYFGIVLGQRGKMPKPIPPKVKIEPFIEAAKKTVRISLKESPVVHVSVGTEDMPDEKIVANMEAVLNFLKEKLPKGKTNIKSAHIKLTMGP